MDQLEDMLEEIVHIKEAVNKKLYFFIGLVSSGRGGKSYGEQ